MANKRPRLDVVKPPPLTIKDRVGDKTARINGLVALRIQRFAATAPQCCSTDSLAPELVGVQTLDISPMVLVVVGQLVVDEHRVLEVRR